MSDAREIARQLAARAPELCKELFPNGVRDGAEYRVGSIQGERGKSLGVHLFGPKAGVWMDFSAGLGGDALTLVAQVRTGGDIKAALDWSRAWLGLPAYVYAGRPVEAGERRERRSPDSDAEQAESTARKRALVQRLWNEARPKLRDTPVDQYLRSRGVSLRRLGRVPGCLRFAPRLWCHEVRFHLPAMVGAIVNAEGELIALHRTYLEERNGKWQKANLHSSKKVLGEFRGGQIRLWRGASGTSLAEAPDGETLVLCEGIENALSIAMACPEYRVLSTVSVSNLSQLRLPAAVKSLIIASDGDRPGSPAEAMMIGAARKYEAEGRTVRIARPPLDGDFNDTLVQGLNDGEDWQAGDPRRD